MDKETVRVAKTARQTEEVRWRDDITSYIGITWARVAEDRKVWNDYKEGNIQQSSDKAQNEKKIKQTNTQKQTNKQPLIYTNTQTNKLHPQVVSQVKVSF